jgi:hypothetical protein
MTTTHDDNATSWRELADQLTPEQIAELEELEGGYRHDARLPEPWWSTAPRSSTEIATAMLGCARGHAADNLNDAR